MRKVTVTIGDRDGREYSYQQYMNISDGDNNIEVSFYPNYDQQREIASAFLDKQLNTIIRISVHPVVTVF